MPPALEGLVARARELAHREAAERGLPRLLDAHSIGGGRVVLRGAAVGNASDAVAAKSAQGSFAKLRREASCAHPERGGIAKIVNELVREGRLRDPAASGDAPAHRERTLPSLSTTASAPSLLAGTISGSMSARVANHKAQTIKQQPLAGSAPASPPSPQRVAKLASGGFDGTPLLSYYEQHDRALHATESLVAPPEARFLLSDASGLRASQQRVPPPTSGVEAGPAADADHQRETSHHRVGRVSTLAASTPSNRSEAIRLNALLDSLLSQSGGSYPSKCHAYNTAFTEVVLQVASHCAERGELLQRLRKFHVEVVRSERDARGAYRATREELRAALRHEERAEKAEVRAAPCPRSRTHVKTRIITAGA